MPTQIPNKFTSWEFTTEEFYGATRFTQMNLMLFQTLAADAATRLVNLKRDYKDKEGSLQEEAALKGEMETYEYLIMLFTDTEVPVAGTEKQAAPIFRQQNFPETGAPK
jgi:hypothetical protein